MPFKEHTAHSPSFFTLTYTLTVCTVQEVFEVLNEKTDNECDIQEKGNIKNMSPLKPD